MSARTPLDRVRGLCLALPETNERLSHGSPTFFIRDKKTFHRGFGWNEIARAIDAVRTRR